MEGRVDCMKLVLLNGFVLFVRSLVRSFARSLDVS